MKAGRNICRQAGMQTKIQTDKNTGRHTTRTNTPLTLTYNTRAHATHQKMFIKAKHTHTHTHTHTSLKKTKTKKKKANQQNKKQSVKKQTKKKLI